MFGSPKGCRLGEPCGVVGLRGWGVCGAVFCVPSVAGGEYSKGYSPGDGVWCRIRSLGPVSTRIH
jgi:hypothetical protein